MRRCLPEVAQRLLQVSKHTSPVRIMGLDELSIRKRQVYDTAIMDQENRQALGVAWGITRRR